MKVEMELKKGTMQGEDGNSVDWIFGEVVINGETIRFSPKKDDKHALAILIKDAKLPVVSYKAVK